MALSVVGKPVGGPQSVPDYTGYAEAEANGLVMHRLFNDTGSTIPSRTLCFETALGMSASDTNGPRAILLVDDALRHTEAVALEAVADQAWGWFAVKGLVDNVIVASEARTTGHAVKVHNGAVATMSANPAYSDSEFAVYLSATDTLTAVDLMLYGREALSTT